MGEITYQHNDIAEAFSFLSSMVISHTSNGKTDYIEDKTRLTIIKFDCRESNLYLAYFFTYFWQNLL